MFHGQKDYMNWQTVWRIGGLSPHSLNWTLNNKKRHLTAAAAAAAHSLMTKWNTGSRSTESKSEKDKNNQRRNIVSLIGCMHAYFLALLSLALLNISKSKNKARKTSEMVCAHAPYEHPECAHARNIFIICDFNLNCVSAVDVGSCHNKTPKLKIFANQRAIVCM